MRQAQRLEGQPYPYTATSLPQYKQIYCHIPSSGKPFQIAEKRWGSSTARRPSYHFLSSGLRLTQPLLGYMIEVSFHPVYWQGCLAGRVQASVQCVDVPLGTNASFGKGGPPGALCYF